jgi:hypothetical protein
VTRPVSVFVSEAMANGCHNKGPMNVTTSEYFTFNVDNSLLLVGQSGSGKSVMCEALFKRYVNAKTPKELRFVILDMTGVDAEILRDEHTEYIEELIEFDTDKAFDSLEKYAELAVSGRKNESSLIFIFIEECNMPRVDQARFDRLVETINKNAKKANIKLIYSTSVIQPDSISKRLMKSFDLMLVGHQCDSEARKYLSVPDMDDFFEYGFIIKEKTS